MCEVICCCYSPGGGDRYVYSIITMGLSIYFVFVIGHIEIILISLFVIICANRRLIEKTLKYFASCFWVCPGIMFFYILRSEPFCFGFPTEFGFQSRGDGDILSLCLSIPSSGGSSTIFSFSRNKAIKKMPYRFWHGVFNMKHLYCTIAKCGWPKLCPAG